MIGDSKEDIAAFLNIRRMNEFLLQSIQSSICACLQAAWSNKIEITAGVKIVNQLQLVMTCLKALHRERPTVKKKVLIVSIFAEGFFLWLIDYVFFFSFL